jgi:hypothetical protein
MPQAPTTAAARDDATANDQVNDGPLKIHRRASANAHCRLRLLRFSACLEIRVGLLFQYEFRS